MIVGMMDKIEWIKTEWELTFPIISMLSSHYGIYQKAQLNGKCISQVWLLVFPSNLNIMVILYNFN